VGVHHVPTRDDMRLAKTRGATGLLRSGSSIGFRGSRQHRQASMRGIDGGLEESLASGVNRASKSSGVDDTPLSDTSDLMRHSKSEYNRGSGLFEGIGSFLYDDCLDDDDCSYVLGSEKRPQEESVFRRKGENDGDDDHNQARIEEEAEQKKLETIEKLYWPFHRMFDIHGQRRMVPAVDPNDDSDQDDAQLLAGYKIPKFVKPLTDRKDGGFEMDARLCPDGGPMTLKGPKGKEIHYEGKIFYMGVIDILQEFTSRKRMESQYRSFQSGALAASCVHPKDYGNRFLEFFDEYTRRYTKEDVSGRKEEDEEQQDQQQQSHKD